MAKLSKAPPILRNYTNATRKLWKSKIQVEDSTYFDFAVCQETPHWLCTGLKLCRKCCIVCLRLKLNMLIQFPLIQVHTLKKKYHYLNQCSNRKNKTKKNSSIYFFCLLNFLLLLLIKNIRRCLFSWNIYAEKLCSKCLYKEQSMVKI